jgi:ribonuclease HI
MTLYKSELKTKADKLSEQLIKAEVSVYYDESSFRDYLLMLKISYKNIENEVLKLYFKPSKKSFSIVKSIKNQELSNIIDKVWDETEGFEMYNSESNICEAFVDGSFIDGITGYGAVIYLGNEIKAELSGTSKETEFNQVGGELEAVIETLKWCSKNSIKQIRINYDYIGIEKFATGQWQAQNSNSLKYVEAVKKSGVDIQWRHIKSHSGNTRNNRADSLAKKAIANAK